MTRRKIKRNLRHNSSHKETNQSSRKTAIIIFKLKEKDYAECNAVAKNEKNK
jgi:hypothetical protein